jgi:predicted deacylase
MVQALTHGNEFSGAIALDYLFRQEVRPARGKLTLGVREYRGIRALRSREAEPVALHRRGLQPGLGGRRSDGPRDSAELRRARELRPFVDAADYLLDLHSMSEACRPIMVCGKSEKSVALSRRNGRSCGSAARHRASGGLRMIERGAFNDPQSPRTAILIETGQHWEKSAVEVAIDTTLRFLMVTGAVDEGWAKSRLRLKPPAVQRLVRVTEAVVAKERELPVRAPMEGARSRPEGRNASGK